MYYQRDLELDKNNGGKNMYNTETMGETLICNTRLETKNIDRHVKSILFDMRFLIDKNNFILQDITKGACYNWLTSTQHLSRRS